MTTLKKKPIKKRKAEVESSSDAWLNVIEKVGEASRERQDKRVKDLTKILKGVNVKLLKDKEIVEMAIQHAGYNSHDPRELKLYKDFVDKLKKEILRRMK